MPIANLNNTAILARIVENIDELDNLMQGTPPFCLTLSHIIRDLITYQGSMKLAEKDAAQLTEAMHKDLLKMGLTYPKYISILLNSNKVIAVHYNSQPPTFLACLTSALVTIADDFPTFLLNTLDKINIDDPTKCRYFLEQLTGEFSFYIKHLAHKRNCNPEQIGADILAEEMFNQLVNKNNSIFFFQRHIARLEHLLNIVKKYYPRSEFNNNETGYLLASLQGMLEVCKEQEQVKALNKTCNSFKTVLAKDIQMQATAMLKGIPHFYCKPSRELDVEKLVDHAGKANLLFQHDKGQKINPDGSRTYSPSVRILRDNCQQYSAITRLQVDLNNQELSIAHRISKFEKEFNNDKKLSRVDSPTKYQFIKEIQRAAHPEPYQVFPPTKKQSSWGKYILGNVCWVLGFICMPIFVATGKSNKLWQIGDALMAGEAIADSKIDSKTSSSISTPVTQASEKIHVAVAALAEQADNLAAFRPLFVNPNKFSPKPLPDAALPNQKQPTTATLAISL